MAGLLVLATLVAPFFLPWAKLRRESAEAGGRALGRGVGIGEVRVGLFSGVRLSDFHVANAGKGYSAQPLFSAQGVRIGVGLLPLLSGKVVVSEIIFVRPELLLETDRRGVSNLSGLGSASPAPPSAAAPSTPAAGRSATLVSAAPVAHAVEPIPHPSGAAVLPIALTTFEIQDATVTLRDDRRPGSDLVLHGLNVKLLGLDLAQGGLSRLEMGLVLRGQGRDLPVSLAADFRLDPAGRSVDVRDLKLMAPALAVSLSGTVTDLKAPGGLLHLAVDSDLQGLPALLAAFRPALADAWAGKIEGAFSAHADVEALPSGREALDRIRVVGSFSLLNGRIQATQAQARLAAVLPSPAAERALAGPLTFALAHGRFAFAHGRLSVEDFSLGSGKDLRAGAVFLQAGGWMDPGGALDFRVAPHFNPSLGFPDGELTRAFQDAQGWPTFDSIEYRGPSPALARADFSAGLKKAAQALWVRHADQIRGLLSKGLSKATPKLRDQVEQGLKGLLGQ